MIDSRWPNLTTIPKAHKGFADSVCARCSHIGAAFNVASGQLFFHLKHDASVGVHTIKVFHPDGTDIKLGGGEIDRTVAYINTGKVPMKIKQRFLREQEILEQKEFMENQREVWEERKPGVRDRINRAVSGRTVATVPGLKGRTT